MSEKDQQDQQEPEGPTEVIKRDNRVSKREFLARVSGNSHIPARTVNRVYDAIIAELMDTMRRGDQLMLTGFGKFYRQEHKGHRVQFADKGSSAIDDYFVLKFSATRNLNKALVEKPEETDLEAREEFFEAEPYLGYDADEVDDDTTSPATTAKTSTSSKASTRKTSGPAPVSLAAAAVQITRAINRARRQSAMQSAKESTHSKPI